MNIETQEISISKAGKLAEQLLQDNYDLKLHDVPAMGITDIINCLFVVQRAKLQEKLGI